MSKKKYEKPILFKMKDKLDHEKWNPKRSPWNVIAPWRGIFMGVPGCGKTTMILNILARMKPHPKRVTIIHPDENSKDYDLVDCEKFTEIPDLEYFSECPGDKQVVVIDDIELKTIGRSELSKLGRLFGYISTHKNVTCLLTSQDPFSIPAQVRRNCNVFVLWKSRDLNALSMLSNRIGLSADELKDLFSKFEDPRDCLVIDDTLKTPYPLRRTFYDILDRPQVNE